MFLFAIVIFMIALVVLMPTPKAENQPMMASGLDGFDFPTADAARSIPELYGTLWLYGNLIWYGNFSSRAEKMCS